ncbi:hypothetical protein ABN034_12710 [Actinopolymorpha sp. B11F2]|uniref:hypothetical protein n=1 Tax=Actinopolymorpha sp. B11F2 TaxID=3160862 RepID=UPI0032E46EA2
MRTTEGATLNGPDGTTVQVEDDEEFRALGFSAGGGVFVYATSPTLYLVAR